MTCIEFLLHVVFRSAIESSRRSAQGIFTQQSAKYATNTYYERMGCEEITQHLNKIATLYLKDNKRKVGWLFVDKKYAAEDELEEIYFISVQKGRKLIYALETGDTKALEPFREVISVDNIERIRSTK